MRQILRQVTTSSGQRYQIFGVKTAAFRQGEETASSRLVPEPFSVLQMPCKKGRARRAVPECKHMQQQRAYRYRCYYPTNTQAHVLARTFGCARFV